MKNVFGKLSKERAVDIRAKLEGFEESPGYQVFRAYFENRARELRDRAAPLANDDFATLNNHNRVLYMAETFEEVLRWAQDAKDQCDSVVEGER